MNMKILEPHASRLTKRYGREDLLPGFSTHDSNNFMVSDQNPVANTAYLIRQVNSKNHNIGSCVFKTTTANGQMDIGYYDENFVRLWSLADSDAVIDVPSGLSEVNFIVPYEVQAGKIFFSAFSFSTALTDIGMITMDDLHNTAFQNEGLKHVIQLSKASSHPLPATISSPVASSIAPYATFVEA